MFTFSLFCSDVPNFLKTFRASSKLNRWCSKIFESVPWPFKSESAVFNNFWKCTMTFQKWTDGIQNVSMVYQIKIEMILWNKYKKYMIQIKIFLISWNLILIKAESNWSARVTYPPPSEIEWIIDERVWPAWIAFT